MDSAFLNFVHLKLQYRYYKSSVNQQPGWNTEAIEWCRKETERKRLKPDDHWGGLVVDEMKIQV